jgi:hypothetical protein
MASRNDYMTVARQIADYMNNFRLAFKTYRVEDLNGMIKSVAGDGARVTGDDTSAQMESALLERGFTVFPKIVDSEDGYVRIIRTNTIVANLLAAFRYPGSDGDAQLAGLLRHLSRRHRADDLDSPDDPS